MGSEAMNLDEQERLYAEGHPSTWKPGDILKTDNFEWVLLEVCGLENRVRVRSLTSNCWGLDDEKLWVSYSHFKLLRRANTEGSGECQSRSNVPDSAGATPAPSAKQCANCGEEPATEPKESPHYCNYCDAYKGYRLEQKPVCDHCTSLALGDSQNYTQADYIRHEDPCQYSASERYMLPLARAMFRERQLAKKVAAFEASVREGDANELKHMEARLTQGDVLPSSTERYSRLTGHKFE